MVVQKQMNTDSCNNTLRLKLCFLFSLSNELKLPRKGNEKVTEKRKSRTVLIIPHFYKNNCKFLWLYENKSNESLKVEGKSVSAVTLRQLLRNPDAGLSS